MLYMVTFTINTPPMLAYIYIPYMDPTVRDILLGYNYNLRTLQPAPLYPPGNAIVQLGSLSPDTLRVRQL